MDVSIIIPLFNESESLKELDDWISLTFKYEDLGYEVIYIDDGSSDSSWDIIKTGGRYKIQNHAKHFLG